MIVTELSGGMGNQMFQYAFGRYLAQKHNTDLFLDCHYLLDRTPKENFVFRNYDLTIFNISSQISSKQISEKYGYLRSKRKKLVQKIIKPKALQITNEPSPFNKEFIKKATDNLYLKGYWQNINYFKEIAEIIKKDFSFKDKISDNCTTLLNDIKSTNSVCLNVRRADFVDNPSHGVLDNSYYKKAAKEIEKNIERPTYYVFSDDVEWCKKNITLDSKTIFVSHSYAGEKFKDYLELMINCKNFIIPNSSFAWWAAWLSRNENKMVIAPKIWLHNTQIKTKTISPKNWIFI